MLKQLTDHKLLVQSLLQGRLFPEQKPQTFHLIETHISSVIVGDDVVYKLKKPINLGFLDFSTLEQRRFYCNEEIRLNRRLSPQLYIDAIAIYGSVDNPTLTASGDAIEYMVRMKPFAQSAQLDRLLQNDRLTVPIMNQFADYIAAFHQAAARVDATDVYGDPATIKLPVDENFHQIRSLIQHDALRQPLQQLQTWSDREFSRLQTLLQQRKSAGFIRECHGDLHLRNLAWMNGQPLAFDCIEFDPKLYWIDVISDLAFLWMDLLLNRRDDLAWALLNQYLSRSGDYASLALLRFYSVYRALVRAKIAAINISQSDHAESRSDLERHMELAMSLCTAARPTVYLMHGPSASGKSTLARQLAAPLQAVILRSDVERKRLFGLSAEQNAAAQPGRGIYSSEATHHTYQGLLELTAVVLDAGYSVIVDATFSQPEQRALFTTDVVNRDYRCVILDLKVSESILRQRIQQRKHDVSDADSLILQQQLHSWQPLTAQEQQYAVTVNLDQEIKINELLDSL